MNFIEKTSVFLKLSKYYFKYANKDLISESGLVNREENFDSDIKEDAKNFVKDLESLGPTFIKLGQVLSTRKELLPIEFIYELKKLQSDVDAVSYEKIKEIVEQELKGDINKIFKKFDKTPIAAASLGQVHKGTLHSGAEVVVKVQRPNITEIISDDIALIKKIVHFLDLRSESFRRLHIINIVNEFEKNIIQELNYLSEAYNLEKINDNLKEFEALKFPKVYKSYSSVKVLTMDFLEGQKLDSIPDIALTELRGSYLANEIFKAYLKQIFIDGFFHSDPHFGNIVLFNKEILGVFDLGMVTRLGPDLRKKLLSLIVAISSGKGKETSDLAYSITSDVDGVDQDVSYFKEQITSLVKDQYDRSLDQIRSGEVLLGISNIASKAGLYFPSELSSIARTLMYLDDLGNLLDPKFNPHKAIRENASELLASYYKESVKMSDLFLGLNDIKDFMREVPSKFNRVLDDFSTGRFKLKVDAIDEDKMLTGFQKIANRITAGLIFSSMIIAAGMIMNLKSSHTLFGYPTLAMILFLFAFLGSFFLLMNILFKDK